MNDRFIVKIQTPLAGDDVALIYDKEKSFVLQVPTEEVVARMAGRVKAYFYARVRGTRLALEKSAPDQEW